MTKVLSILCCVAAAIAVGFTAGRGAMAPATIGCVDLERVFNECIWLAEAEEQLAKITAVHQKEADRLRAEVELARQDLELLVPGTEQYKKAERAYVQATVDFRAYVEFSGAKLEVERAKTRRNIYDRIAGAAERYAVAHGIGYIITNDSASDLQEGTDRQVVQQLLLRRVVYASSEYDVTDDLITWIKES